MDEVAKTILTAGTGAVVALYFQHVLPRLRTTTALKADSDGASRMAADLIPRVQKASKIAAEIELDLASDREVAFDKLTELPNGWIITAPSPDLFANAERFDEDSARAVIKYLHYWRTVLVLEERYRSSLDAFLVLYAASNKTPQATVVLRERMSRVRDHASSLSKGIAVLRAQAKHFVAGEIVALSDTEESDAERCSC